MRRPSLGKNRRRFAYSVLFILFISFFSSSLFTLIPSVSAQPTEVLFPKWTSPRFSGGTEGTLIVDVDGDGDEEVIWAYKEHVVALDPYDGHVIWDHYDPYIYFWVQAQIADLEDDGDWEVIVPLSGYLEEDKTGIMVLNALDGSLVWRIPETPNDTGGLGGTSHSSPVIADVDGDGFKEIFTVTTDIYTDPNGYDGTGKVVKLSYDGQILATQWSWRSCSGGFSIGDLDEDGEFELYMGDRNSGMGQGVISYSATDLTPRWNDFSMMVSSNIPVIADVNGDGQLDLISSHHSGGIAIYNMDGSVIRKDLTFRYGNVLAGHYQHSVYDIDYDGNLEILVADGEHSGTSQDLVIWDLVDWVEDGRLLGEGGLRIGTTPRYMFFAPLIADVTGDGRMDVVATSWDGVSQGGIHVFTYEEGTGFVFVDEYLFLAYYWPNRAIAQDIDEDGLMEICVSYQGDGVQGGRVWAFDTLGLAPQGDPDGDYHPELRPRSEVQFYSERRMAAAEYVPLYVAEAPTISDPSPADGSMSVPLISELSFDLWDYHGDPIDYTVTTTPNIGLGGGTDVADGRYSVGVSGLDYGTVYSWTVSASDGTHVREKTYSFTTMPLPLWWDSNWLYRKSIIIDPAQVSEDQTDFPILVDLVDSDLIGKAQADFDDIVFVDASNTKLSHEIEAFDSSTGALTAWVKLPFVSSSDYTYFLMYYGNAGASNQQDPAAVWDASYKLVLHLSEVSGPCLDSTIDGHSGSVSGVVAQGTTGVIDGGYAFDGDSGYVEFAHSSGFAGYTEAFTASFWLSLDNTSRRQRVLNKFDNVAGDMAWFIDYQTHATYGPVLSFFGSADGSSFVQYHASFTPVAGTWYYVAVVWEANSVPKFYVDGIQLATIGASTISSIYDNVGVPLEVGRAMYNTGRYLDGRLDEVRLSNPARSAGYIWASYINQMNPGAFLQIGQEESGITQPVIFNPVPANGAVEVSAVTLSELSFDLIDYQGDLMNYTVTITPDVGSTSDTGVSSGTVIVPVSGVENAITYIWEVSVTDGSEISNAIFTFTTRWLVDNDFETSVDSADLRANTAGQDWYDSRYDDPTILFLDENNVGGNTGKKAGFYGDYTHNSYMSQEFSEPQYESCTVQWDIYVDSIINVPDSYTDRAGLMMVGNNGDSGGEYPDPNRDSGERFVYMAFYKDGGATTGPVDLVSMSGSYEIASTIASGLYLDQWYTIRVECDLVAQNYDVYVDGVLVGVDVAPENNVTYIDSVTFAQWNDGAGQFYIDNVYAPAEELFSLRINVEGSGSAFATPTDLLYVPGTLVSLEAVADAGGSFIDWTGDLTSSSASESILMDSDKSVTANFVDLGLPDLIVDSDFEGSVDTAALIADSAGQDWYESLNENPFLLYLDETNVAGNDGKKAGFVASPYNDVYLSQEFGYEATGVFSVQWDVYVDSILDIDGNPDRAAWMMIGDDMERVQGPNRPNVERFVYMAFERDGGALEGTMDLVARDNNDGWSTFTTVATGLNLDQWYTIRVVCDLDADTYDVYVDDVYQATVASRNEKTFVNAISFAQWFDGAGAFYIDNVISPSETRYRLDVNVEGSGSVVLTPGDSSFAPGTTVSLEAIADGGGAFIEWTGDLTGSSSTESILMDGDKSVTANFVFLGLPEVIVDSDFEDSGDSAALIADGAGQDWYESRDDVPTLLFLDESDVGGNTGKKAGFTASDSGNAYMSQEFGYPLTGTFSVQWDVYVDSILDIGDPDRAAWMFVGTSLDGIRGPNSADGERFVYLAFAADGGATEGTMNLTARDNNDGWSDFTLIATDLNLDQWYTIRVVCDLDADTYDVYVDDVYQATVASRSSKVSVDAISFAQWNDGAGAFYVDNVFAIAETWTITASAGTGGSITPVGDVVVPSGEDQLFLITADPGYSIAEVVVDGSPIGIVTEYTFPAVDADHTISATFIRYLALEGTQSWYWSDDTVVNDSVVGDVDGDNDMEIVTGGYFFDGVRNIAQLIVWDGATMTVEDVQVWYWGDSTEITSVAIGDVDGDSDVEIVTGGYYDVGSTRIAQLHVWNGADLAFEDVQVWYWGDSTEITSVAIGDVDGDSDVEIVTGGYYFDGVRNIAQLQVWDGANLSFEDVVTWYWAGDTEILSISVDHVDADGDLEIVTGGYCDDGSQNRGQLNIFGYP